MLERQIISGDRQAIRLAFSLTSVADGAYEEDLEIILGSLLRINPKLFIDVLTEFYNTFAEIDGLVGNEGEVYVWIDDILHFQYITGDFDRAKSHLNHSARFSARRIFSKVKEKRHGKYCQRGS